MGTLSGYNMLAGIVGTFTGSGTLDSLVERIDIQNEQALSNGNTAATTNANQIWTDSRSLTATSENLDLAGGLTDAFGSTLTFTTVKLLMIKNTSTTSGENLTLSGNFLELDPFSGTSPTLDIDPGGVLFLSSPIDGYTVTGSTADILTINSGSDTITYEIVIVGTVA